MISRPVPDDCAPLHLLFIACFTAQTNAATIEEAYHVKTGEPMFGLKIEGVIESGDADRFRDKLIDYNLTHTSNPVIDVYLRSPGGSVEEAWKLGILIRQLRLETDVPDKLGDKPILDPVRLSDQSNELCASACFLIYAAGVQRHGNYLLLHRLFLPREVANQFTDEEWEKSQKGAMQATRQYLQSMEIDQFFIDKMMETNSHETYEVTMRDQFDHHLNELVPSIQEIVLTKCDDLKSAEAERLKHINTATPEGRAEWARQMGQINIDVRCQFSALNELRAAAFDRLKKQPNIPNNP